uniref:AP-3 complex subunit beta-1-like n=1 Tax=Diabrotica virgifera virgifera TaxID=50390 RepID=A0A6P7GSY9_DIAVI
MWGSWESEASSGGNSSDYGSSTSSSSESDDMNEEDTSEEESSEEETSKKGSESEESQSSSEESSSADEAPAKQNQSLNSTNNTTTESVANSKKSNLDLLLDLDDIDNPAPVMTPSLGGFFSPSTPLDVNTSIQIVQPVFLSTKPVELLNRINGKGLSATFRFTRTPHLYSPSMTNINLLFSNTTGEDVDDIRIGKKNLAFGMNLHDFACISKLPPNCALPATLGIDFNDTTQPANFEIVSSLGKFNVSLKPNIGELLRPATMSTALFLQNQTKLRGMTEHSKAVPNCVPDIEEKIKECTNLGPCDRSDPKYFRFGGQTMTSSSLVLVCIECSEESTNLIVNCENIVFGSVMLNELITILSL